MPGRAIRAAMIFPSRPIPWCASFAAESGQVMLVSRVRSTVHLPINAEGYLESLRGAGEAWVLN